jgi:prepilin-type N-terminal cleavage/methylation domain-containing protein
MVRKRLSRRGVTLVELMVVTAIIGIIMAIVPKMYLQTRRFFFLSNSRLELQRDSRMIMSQITRELRQADSDTIVIDRYGAQPNYSKIAFTDVNNRTVVCYQSGKNLNMAISGGTKTLTTNLRYVSFALPRSNDMSIVSVAITLEKGTYEGRTKFLHMASEKVRVMN